jgi:phosphatidyl-myo-inositol alpha-mannosyltransferase
MRKAQKLNVGLVFDDSLDSTDGVAQHVKTIGSWLSSQGHSVSYLVGETHLKRWHEGEVFSLAKNLPVIFNGNRLSIPLPARRSTIKTVLADGQFDVIHIMMPYSPFMAQRVIRQASSSTAVVGTFHIYPSGRLVKTGARLLKLVSLPSLHRFSYFISVSQAAASFARSAYGIESKVIANPVDVSIYSDASGIANHKPDRAVFLGRLVKRKGCSQLIDAFADLKKRLPAAELVIAGDGPLRSKLQAKVKRLGLSEAVSFLGFIDEKDKPKFLASASVACFPSLYGESFGIVLVEAMAAGADVVLGGDNPGYRTILAEHAWSLVDPQNRESFADKLYDALSDETKRTQAKLWQGQAVRKYDIEIIGPEIEKVYDLAIARTTKNGHNVSHE